MDDGKELKFRRRKTARPSEIVDAALEVFADKGFAGARLDEIALRANVSKGTLYLYFETKEAIFRAVVESHVAPEMAQIQEFVRGFKQPFAELVPSLLRLAAERISTSRIPAVGKIVVAESKNFPDLARIWYTQVITPMTAVFAEHIRRAQVNGEVKPGIPELYVLSMMAPIMIGLLFREVFSGLDILPPDLQMLAAQHGRLIVAGMTREDAPKKKLRKN